MTTYLRFENSRRDAIASESVAIEYTDDEELEQMDLADNAPWFRYTV